MVCDVCDECWGHVLNAVLPMLCTLIFWRAWNGELRLLEELE